MALFGKIYGLSKDVFASYRRAWLVFGWLLIGLVQCPCTLFGANREAASPDILASAGVSVDSLSPPEIFSQISPSVAFVETPASTGSGMLLEDGYVVTNAHVVWPYSSVRLVFSNGAEFLDVPVINVDLMTDLAVVGPVETGLDSLNFSNGEDLLIGSTVYLVGYPGEVDLFPQPAITRGLISRLREWESQSLTYFQTDALIAGGQSGGVLVSDRGEVIGISGFTFTDSNFGLVASAQDIAPLVERLLQGEDVDGLGVRSINPDGGKERHQQTLRDWHNYETFAIQVPPGTEVELEVTGENSPRFDVVSVYGEFLSSMSDTEETGLISDTVYLDLDAPYFVRVGQDVDEEGAFAIESNYPLIPQSDPDDGIELAVNSSLVGNLDYPGDVDYFTIELEADQAIWVTVDSVLIDAYLSIDYLGGDEDDIWWDDDSGIGLFGENAELWLKAPHDGTYRVIVEDYSEINFGGYQLSVVEDQSE